MKTIRYDTEAIEEIKEAKMASSNRAEFDREVEAAIELLRNGFVTGVKTRIWQTREWILPRLPYSLIYEENDAELVLVAFAHHRRKPGYWKRRLRP